MIKFLSLTLKNFRSYEKLFLGNLNERGLTLISGTNGTGKSSIRQAIEYLLLDKTSDNIPVDELPRDGDKSCMLNCALEMPNGDLVDITKYRNDRKYDNKTIVEINGDDSLTATDRRVTKKNIDKLLGITPELLFSSTMFSSNSPSFVECAEADRKEILYNFIDRETYDSCAKSAEIEFKDREKAIQDLENQLRSEEDQLDTTEGYYNSLDSAEENHVAEIKAEIVGLLRERDDLEEKSITSIMEELEELYPQVKDIDDNRINRLVAKQESIRDTTNEVEREHQTCQMKLDGVDNSICPILKTECSFLIEKRDEVRKQWKPVENELRGKVKVLSNKSRDCTSKIKVIRAEIDETLAVANKIERLQDRADQIKEYNSTLDSLREQFDERIKNKSKSLKTNKFAELREKAEKDIKTHSQAIVNIKNSIKVLQEQKELYAYWMNGYGRGGIPNMKMDGILGSLEEETNRYLSKISNNIFVEIDAQKELKASKVVREKISYTVNHPDKAIKSYNSYSGGQRQRVKLADIFAFNTLLGKFDIMILDEVLEGSIDDEGKSVVIELLKEKAKELGTLFVVSHDDYIKDSFDSVLNVTMKNGVSQIGG
jgi:DNA repair exonuclease SbcCD ATPase subunit